MVAEQHVPGHAALRRLMGVAALLGLFAMHGVAAMCLAVLPAGIALSVLRRRGFDVPRRGLPAHRGSPRPGGSRPHQDPPCLFTLSVQRC
jgi:hypothetical protein